MQYQMIALMAVLTILFSQTTATFIPGNECINYTILHEASRSKFYSNYTTNVSDTSLTGWFTFNGSAGKQMSTSCVPSNRCGTLVAGWMAGTHPGVEEGVVKRSACFSMKQLCCIVFVSMCVKNCSGFYVYKLDTMPSFNFSFRLCGEGVKGSLPLLQAGSKNLSENDYECISYKTLNEDDRAADYFSYHTMKCDANLPQVWYRLTGRAGTVMPTKCVPKMHCGALSPGWLNGKHPTVGEGVAERMICFTKDDDCCHWYSKVLVRNCSDFIVYRFGQFPTAQHFCSLRYCGAGRAGCKDKDGNFYDVGQNWNPNPLFTCKCTPKFQVLCTKTQTGCWDFHGNAFADGQEWLSNSKTKCGCRNGKITCTKLSQPACTDESGIVREHGNNWFPGACFNCTCADGLVSCIKYHVAIQYALFRVETVGNCKPCRRPSEDIMPTGNGTVSACQVFLQLEKSNELFRCSSGDFIRKHHVCNGITECFDGSDEAQCQDVVCRDEEGQVLVLKDVWKVTDCITCKCRAARDCQLQGMAVRIHSVTGSPNSQTHRRSVPASNPSSQDTVYTRPATHRPNGAMAQAPGSPRALKRAAQFQKEAVARPKPDRASSPNGSNSAVFPAQIQVGGSLRPVDKIDSDRHGYVSPQKGHAGFSHSGGYFSPNGSPPMSPQVPVNFSMVCPPSPPVSLEQNPPIQFAKSAQAVPTKPILGRRYVPQDFNQQHLESKEPTMVRATTQLTAGVTFALPTKSASSSHLHGVRERSWDREDPFYKLRQEIQMQCNIHADMIRSEVSNMCQETGRRLQDVIDKMQDTRDEETGQVQTMMRALDMKVNECHQKLVELLNDDSSKPIHPADLEVFQKELEAERVCRRDLIKDVYARINEEMIRVTKVMDEHRAAALEAVAQERWARSEDAAELRATFGAMRSQACNVEKKDVQAVNMRGEEHPEDPEDLYTLYEMVREALGDTVHLRQLLAEEKSERIHEFSSNRQQMDMLSRELNTMQALLREAAAGRTEAQ